MSQVLPFRPRDSNTEDEEIVDRERAEELKRIADRRLWELELERKLDGLIGTDDN